MNGSRVLSGQSTSTSAPRLVAVGPACRPPALQQRRQRAARCRVQAAALDLFSPSKVNLFLRVVRRREDGYHDLASLFHVIDLGDDMRFEPLPGAQADELSCDMPDVPTDSSNLVIKALDLFRQKTGSDQFYRVRLDKQVPAGAGLGGGSANAATSLWAANELSGRPASNSDLLQWSGEIGSDISVFFSEGAAYCTGRGEIVENVAQPLPLSTPLLLVKPPVGCSTPQIFRALRLEARSSADPRGLLDAMTREGRLTQELCCNDLEQPAFDTLEELRALKARLQTDSDGRFSAVFMTGSGSTIVCVGSDQPPAFLAEPAYSELFVRPARLIARRPGQWYARSSVAAEAAAAAA